jgi:STE24 endopeptidase
MNDRIKRYARIKYSFAVINIVYLLFILALFQFSGLAVWLHSALSRILAGQFTLIFFYCLVLFSLYSLLDFPLDYYRSYSIEHRFGLSQENFLHWLIDQFKQLLVGFIIFIILVEGFFHCLRHYPQNWWWMAGLFWIFFSLVLARIFPVLIIPLFFKYKKIQDEGLRQRILSLGNRMGVSIQAGNLNRYPAGEFLPGRD